MRLVPGVTKEMRNAASNIDDKELNRVEGIVHSMTRAERANPKIIDASRRARIARGAASTVPAVNQLLKQFTEMQKMMKQMGAGSAPSLPGGLGKMAAMASRAQARGELPSGLGSLPGSFAKATPSASSAAGSKKKKKGGRVTPPKQR